jgi:hypothetical protein
MAGGTRFSATRRLEAWLWTGPPGHLLGGAIDFSVVLARALVTRYRSP